MPLHKELTNRPSSCCPHLCAAHAAAPAVPAARRDAAKLERFVEVWEPVLPPAALAHIMEHLVLPRLRAAVSAWDPLRDTVALHTWVHPWLVRRGSIKYCFSVDERVWVGG